MESLKQKYAKKLLTESISERISLADKKVLKALNENKKLDLILEKFDQQQMAQATDLIKKLKSLDFSKFKTLSQGRDKAISDVTAALSGQGSLVKKIIGLFSSEKENPLVDSLAFTGAMYNFFSTFSQYVKSIAGEDTDKTLMELVTGKTEDELGDISAVSGLGQEEKKKIDNIKKLIARGMKPEGKIINFSKNWIDKYLNGKEGLETLSDEMLKIKVKDLQAVIADTTNSLKTVNSVNDSVANASEKQTTPTSSTTGSEKSTTTSTSQSTKPTSPSSASSTKNTQNKAQQVAAVLKKAKLDQGTIKKVVTTLSKNNLL